MLGEERGQGKGISVSEGRGPDPDLKQRLGNNRRNEQSMKIHCVGDGSSSQVDLQLEKIRKKCPHCQRGRPGPEH